MALKNYNFNDNTKISNHFNVSEFKCKCGKCHDILIDDNLIILLERVMIKLNASICNIYSGFRCIIHDINVGGNGFGPHTKGYAVDCYFKDKDGMRIPSKNVCLALEDLGHLGGIGYRCGGCSNESGNTHIDTLSRKWYGNEALSMNKSCCNSFYDYFGIKKEQSINYQVYDNVKKYWLPNVKINTSEYAGNLGNSISALYIDNLKYRVHDKVKNKWLPIVIGRCDYAGNLGNPIDGIQIENAIYRVHLKNGKWLSWIKKMDNTNNGYAGIYGYEIDAIQVKKQDNLEN